MSTDNIYYLNQEDEESEGTSGQAGGGQSSIEFVDFLIPSQPPKNESLTKAEQKHLIGIHREKHKDLVKKQKEKIDEYRSLREGKITLAAHRLGKGGELSPFKANPELADKPQFAGIDRTINALPNEQISDTNNDKRDELKRELTLRLQPENAPTFNPKPFPGG